MNISIDFHGVKLYNIGEKRNFSPIYFSVPGGDIVVYIVSDERIAVENFEQGKIYKVDFVDETVLYGVCVGIGSDFVMLSGDISGYIYPLTMQTASQVSSIDLYDPTPPEPPVPWTNLLQYQTGVPGFEFNTTDTSLFSWYIEGEGVGDKTANLFDKETATIIQAYPNTNANEIRSSGGSRSTYIECQGNTTYTVCKTAGTRFIVCTTQDIPNVNVAIYDAVVQQSASTITITTSASAQYLVVFFWNNTDSITEQQMLDSVVIVEGETAPSEYIPYGYKIQILCNEHLTNIYLDAPLSEGEILYSTDIDTAIVTDIGDNELSVETTQQPTDMQIVYKIADR